MVAVVFCFEERRAIFLLVINRFFCIPVWPWSNWSRTALYVGATRLRTKYKLQIMMMWTGRADRNTHRRDQFDRNHSGKLVPANSSSFALEGGPSTDLHVQVWVHVVLLSKRSLTTRNCRRNTSLAVWWRRQNPKDRENKDTTGKGN
jgi:hypothetical protein